MEIIMAALIGSLIGFAAPLFGRGVGPAPLDMLIGAVGALIGVALNQLIHADNNLMVVFGAALLLALVASFRGRIVVARSAPPAG